MENVPEQQKRRKRFVSFNPNREYISDAVEQFLKQGGKITQLQAGSVDVKEKLEDSWLDLEDNMEADEFLYE